MSSPLLEFSFCERAIAGARPYQEDSSRVWRPNGSSAKNRPLLVVLADGMGGHVSGEVASRLAAEQYIQAFSSEQGSVDQRLEHALHAGNDALLSAIRKEKSLDGMGCTLVAGYLDQDGLRWASVGDSMLLLFRDRVLIRKNESHSLGALLDLHAQANVISEEEAKNSPRRHTLRSALTGAPIPLKQIEPQAHPLLPGDWIVMASDGLETLSGDQIAQIISENADQQPEVVADALLDNVEKAGLPNQDNTTVVVIRVQDPTLEPTRIVSQMVRQPAQSSSAASRTGITTAVACVITAVIAGWLFLGEGLQTISDLFGRTAAVTDASKTDTAAQKADAAAAKADAAASKAEAAASKTNSESSAKPNSGAKNDDRPAADRTTAAETQSTNKPAEAKPAEAPAAKETKPRASDARSHDRATEETAGAAPAADK